MPLIPGGNTRLGEALQQSERVDDRLRVPAQSRGGVIVKRIDVAAVLGDERQKEVRAGVAREIAPGERDEARGLELGRVGDQLVPGVGHGQAHLFHDAVVGEDAEVLGHVGEAVRLAVEGVLPKRSLEELLEERRVELVLEVDQQTRAAELARLGAAVEHVGQRTSGDHRGQGRKVLAERDEIALDLDAWILGLESGDRLVPIGGAGDIGGLPAHHMQRGLGQRGVKSSGG